MPRPPQFTLHLRHEHERVIADSSFSPRKLWALLSLRSGLALPGRLHGRLRLCADVDDGTHLYDYVHAVSTPGAAWRRVTLCPRRILRKAVAHRIE
eukprot:2127842-Prymnesium_polylepis.1